MSSRSRSSREVEAINAQVASNAHRVHDVQARGGSNMSPRPAGTPDRNATAFTENGAANGVVPSTLANIERLVSPNVAPPKRRRGGK